MQEQINENFKKTSTWEKIFFIVVFVIIVGLVRILLWVVILLQIASTLLTGTVNTNILNFGRSLSAYLYHILLFLTFNTNTLPFPFSAWKITEELDLPQVEQNKDNAD